MTNASDIIATGGFNTGRLYSREGQRIYWAQRADGRVYFSDRDRMIDGVIDRDYRYPADHAVTPRWIMQFYDKHQYNYPTGKRPSVPDDFDYGAALRI